MGVVNNEIRIAGLEANTAGIMTSVNSLKSDVTAMGEKTQLSIEPFNSRVGNIQKVYAYIRDNILFVNFKCKVLIAATGADQIQLQLAGFDYAGTNNAYFEAYDETTGVAKKYYIGAYQDKISLRIVDSEAVDDVINFNLVIPIG